MTIFYIEDDYEDKELFQDALNEINPSIHFLTTENGQLALQLLQNEKIHPDFIFLDINMPVMNGNRFLMELRKDERFKSIPVIVCSTSKYETASVLAMGATDFFVKPGSYTQLIQIISEKIFMRAEHLQ